MFGGDTWKTSNLQQLKFRFQWSPRYLYIRISCFCHRPWIHIFNFYRCGRPICGCQRSDLNLRKYHRLRWPVLLQISHPSLIESKPGLRHYDRFSSLPAAENTLSLNRAHTFPWQDGKYSVYDGAGKFDRFMCHGRAGRTAGNALREKRLVWAGLFIVSRVLHLLFPWFNRNPGHRFTFSRSFIASKTGSHRFIFIPCHPHERDNSAACRLNPDGCFL